MKAGGLVPNHLQGYQVHVSTCSGGWIRSCAVFCGRRAPATSRTALKIWAGPFPRYLRHLLSASAPTARGPEVSTTFFVPTCLNLGVSTAAHTSSSSNSRGTRSAVLGDFAAPPNASPLWPLPFPDAPLPVPPTSQALHPRRPGLLNLCSPSQALPSLPLVAMSL